MEITLKRGTYALNPRRIIFIEYYRIPPCNGKYVKQSENYRLNKLAWNSSELNEDEDKDFLHMIKIHLTDDKEITFSVDNEEEYESIRDELKRVVGG